MTTCVWGEAALKKVSPASLREQLYESIMEAILTNQYHPGDLLQIDRLAHDFGVSTTPVREALVRLEIGRAHV